MPSNRAVARIGYIREAQVPELVLVDRLHEGICDADGNVEIGNGVLVGLAAYEILDIRMVDAQHGHVGSPARATLGNFAEGMVVYAQETHRAGGFPGRGVHQAAGRPQA